MPGEEEAEREEEAFSEEYWEQRGSCFRIGR
jgi:hypothetical protein